MHFHNINLLAVLVAAISTMVVGFLWYSPCFCRKPWMKEMGYDPNDKARMEEMKEKRRPGVWRFVRGQPSFRVHTGTPPARDASGEPAYWPVGRVSMFGLASSPPCNSHPALFTKQSMKLFGINNRLSARMLSRYGSNPHRLALNQWREPSANREGEVVLRAIRVIHSNPRRRSVRPYCPIGYKTLVPRLISARQPEIMLLVLGPRSTV